jgi:hypothetical protein
MKFSDITGQDVTTLTEAPMGFMKTLGTAVKSINPFSLSGRSQAQGQFKTGVSANQIYAQYYKWLGQSGTTADTDSVIAFLQQNGYGEQAITAAQSKFPKVQQQTAATTAANTTEPTTGQTQTTNSPPNYSGGTTPAPAPTKINYSGMPNLKPLPKATSGQGAYSAKNPYATSAASKPAGPTQAELDADHERMASGANENRRIRESHRKLREAIALNKQQLSAIFTAVVQSGAVPQQNTTTGNSVGTGTTGQDDDDAPSSSGAQSSRSSNDPGSSGNSGRSSQLPNRLTPDDILQYYARLTSPYEREQVKKGISEVDKQLSQGVQQTKQQSTK